MTAPARNRDFEFGDQTLSTAETVVGFSGQRHRIVLSEPKQKWADGVIAQIEDLLQLSPGWDGHQAPRLKLETVFYAWRVLTVVCKPNTPAPFVVPTTAGGLQFEWHRPGLDIELNVRAAAHVEFFAEAAGGLPIEKELTVDFRSVVPWVDQLS
jgi:hypothetical protein